MSVVWFQQSYLILFVISSLVVILKAFTQRVCHVLMANIYPGRGGQSKGENVIECWGHYLGVFDDPGCSQSWGLLITGTAQDQNLIPKEINGTDRFDADGSAFSRPIDRQTIAESEGTEEPRSRIHEKRA